MNSGEWIIDARWYFTPIVFLLGVISSNDAPNIELYHQILFELLILVLFINFILWNVVRKMRKSRALAQHIDEVNRVQVIVDLCYFFMVMILTGGAIESLAHIFFFIPIIVSVILFGFAGSVTIGISSGILVLISIALSHSGYLEKFGLYAGYMAKQDLAIALTKGSIIFIIYLITAFFAGYIARLIRSRDELLFEKMRKEEEHVRRLQILTDEFDRSAKLLVRRDLELTKANESLTRLDELKSEIISVAAHQLRTPLTAIKWTFRMMLDEDAGKISNEQQVLLKKGYESNERMITLVNDMLSVDRMESGKIKYRFFPIQLEELIQTMISDLLPLANEKGISVRFLHPDNLLEKISLDPEKMRDVLQNLIDNAIKYSRKGGTVIVSMSQVVNGKVTVSITDSGIGIPVSQQDKIFSRFYRATNATRAETNGSGLGLFIAQSIIKRHGGIIWFTSVENSGTSFHFMLPIE